MWKGIIQIVFWGEDPFTCVVLFIFPSRKNRSIDGKGVQIKYEWYFEKLPGINKHCACCITIACHVKRHPYPQYLSGNTCLPFEGKICFDIRCLGLSRSNMGLKNYCNLPVEFCSNCNIFQSCPQFELRLRSVEKVSHTVFVWPLAQSVTIMAKRDLQISFLWISAHWPLKLFHCFAVRYIFSISTPSFWELWWAFITNRWYSYKIATGCWLASILASCLSKGAQKDHTIKRDRVIAIPNPILLWQWLGQSRWNDAHVFPRAGKQLEIEDMAGTLGRLVFEVAHLFGKFCCSAVSTTVCSSKSFWTMNWARSPTTLLLGVTCRSTSQELSRRSWESLARLALYDSAWHSRCRSA